MSSFSNDAFFTSSFSITSFSLTTGGPEAVTRYAGYKIVNTASGSDYVRVLDKTDKTDGVLGSEKYITLDDLFGDIFSEGIANFKVESIDTLSAGETSLWLYDEDAGSLQQVTVGADDSGGSGYKVLRIPN